MLYTDPSCQPLSQIHNHYFSEEIINCMTDWVRVIDREDNVIFLNKAMRNSVADQTLGTKCYLIIGKDKPCENCTSRLAVCTGMPQEKEETINGRIYQVVASPIQDESDHVVAVVEVLRDITQMKKLQDDMSIQNKKLQKHLDIAKKLQLSLLPKELPGNKVDFSYIYTPCEELGGDFFDIFNIDENHVGVYIADISGHGVSASMLTVFLRSSLNRKMLSPSSALSELYKKFNSNYHDLNLYITVFYMIIDLKTMTMTYSNAGHNVCPVVFNKEGYTLLRSPGIPISNWVKNLRYADKKFDLQREDRIFLYTDGVVELNNDKNEQFGEERLLEILLNDTSEPADTLQEIIARAQEFAGSQDFEKLSDDITVALIKIK